MKLRGKNKNLNFKRFKVKKNIYFTFVMFIMDYEEEKAQNLFLLYIEKWKNIESI